MDLLRDNADAAKLLALIDELRNRRLESRLTRYRLIPPGW